MRLLKSNRFMCFLKLNTPKLEVFVIKNKLLNTPNLLLAGSPKCGTSSVYDWLLEHGDVSGGVAKEVFYLMDSHETKYVGGECWNSQGEEGYAKKFPIKNNIVVDGTTLTMYQESALEYAVRCQPKVIFFLRNPAKRAYSTFKYFRDSRSVIDKYETFGTFLNNAKRSKYSNTQLNDVIEHGRYCKYINEWKSVIGDENIKIYLFEEFIKDPAGVMIDICTWLNIESDLYKEFSFNKKNETVVVRSVGLNKIKEKFSKYLPKGKPVRLLRELYYKVNSSEASDGLTNEDKALISELSDFYKAENKSLKIKYNLNTDIWL
jgi:hypothetical protein